MLCDVSCTRLYRTAPFTSTDACMRMCREADARADHRAELAVKERELAKLREEKHRLKCLMEDRENKQARM